MNKDNWLIFGVEKLKRQNRMAQPGCNSVGTQKFAAPFYETRNNSGTLSEIRQHMQTYCISNTLHINIQLYNYIIIKQIG